jgi:hypothetical protein
MITDSGGDKVWRYFFAKPPTRTKLSPETKALLEEALIFTPRRDVARVISFLLHTAVVFLRKTRLAESDRA